MKLLALAMMSNLAGLGADAQGHDIKPGGDNAVTYALSGGAPSTTPFTVSSVSPIRKSVSVPSPEPSVTAMLGSSLLGLGILVTLQRLRRIP